MIVNSMLASSWPQVGPRWLMLARAGRSTPQVGPSCAKLAQVGPKWIPSWPKLAPCWPMLGQAGPKLAPSWPQVGPKLAHVGPSWPMLGQTGPKLVPSWSQVGPKLAHVGSSWSKLVSPLASLCSPCQGVHEGSAFKGSPLSFKLFLVGMSFLLPPPRAYARRPTSIYIYI